MTRFAGLLMVKNEEKNIKDTIESCNILDGLIIYDTGSTDKTLEIIKDTCKIKLHIKIGEFEDFAISRNVLLEFANEFYKDYDYYILLDSEDIIVGKMPNFLISSISKGTDLTDETYYIKNIYKNGKSITTFNTLKFLKSNTKCIFKQPVHEYLYSENIKGFLDDFHIFQYRNLQQNRRSSWEQHKIIVEKEYEKNH